MGSLQEVEKCGEGLARVKQFGLEIVRDKVKQFIRLGHRAEESIEKEMSVRRKLCNEVVEMIYFGEGGCVGGGIGLLLSFILRGYVGT